MITADTSLYCLSVNKDTMAPINTRPICCLWSKIKVLGQNIKDPKSATIPFHTRYIFTTIESFKMRHYMKFYLKGQKSYQMSKSNVPKTTYLIK